MGGFVAWLSKQSILIQVLMGVGLLALIVFVSGQVQSCRYDKSRAELEEAKKAYEARDAERAKEAAAAIARAEAAEKRAQELESKVVAYEKLAETKSGLDAREKEKIDAVIAEGEREAANTNVTTDCRERAKRLGAKFRALGINISDSELIEKCPR